MTQWINSNELEYVTPDGETKILTADQIDPNQVFSIGLSAYKGSELLAIKPD